jgi:GxxExxY protein
MTESLENRKGAKNAKGLCENRKDAKNAKEVSRADLEKTATAIIDSAVAVHRALGLGLLESAYHACLAYELRSRGHKVVCEIPLPIEYKGVQVDGGYRIDMLVDDCVIIENKAVERLLPIHTAQVITYLKLSDRRLGFLLNWHVKLIKQGIKRLVNNL